MYKRFLIASLTIALLPIQAFALSDIGNSRNKEAIQYLSDKGVIGGYPDGTFKPQNTVNRAELVKILVGGKGVTPTLDQYSDCFPDVQKEWFAPFVCYAKEQGWVSGYPDGTFRPSNTVNTVEAIKMIVNSQGYAVPDSVVGSLYADADVSAWYAPFVKAAKDKGILEQVSGNLGVNDGMKRGGVAESIYRAVIINEQALERYDAEAHAPQVNTSPSDYTYDVKRIELTTSLENTDGNSDKDALRIGTYWYFISRTDSSEGEISGRPNNEDWTAKVSIYDRQSGGEQGKLLYEHQFAKSEVQYPEDGYPYVDVPVKEIKDAGHLYGIVEVTFTSSRGTYSAKDDFATLRESTDESLATENQVKKLNLKSISVSYFWWSWDADAENDGFKFHAYFKDDKGEQVYPNSKDWTITVNIYNSEMDYDKYSDFKQHRIGSPVTLTFKGKDVVYESSLGTPYVNVPKEKIPFPSVEHGQFIVEGEFSSPTYGTFSGQTDVPDWRNK